MGWRNKPRGGKPDQAQKQIVTDLRAIGAVVLIVSMIPHSFDILVFYKSKIHVMEIKNEGSASTQKLTEGEAKFQKQIESVGVKYHIVTNSDQAIKIIS